MGVKRHRLRRFMLGSVGLLALFGVLAFSTPRGAVVQRNVHEDVDATPLFYTESDRLPELERQLSKDRTANQ